MGYVVVNKHIINYIEVYIVKRILTSCITNLNVRWIVTFYELDLVPGKYTYPMLRIVGASLKNKDAVYLVLCKYK